MINEVLRRRHWHFHLFNLFIIYSFEFQDTLAKMLGPKFTPKHKEAWVWVYGIIAGTMQSKV